MKTKNLIIAALIFIFSAGMLGAQENTGTYAEVNGTKLYYTMSGSGTAIVFIHGWSFDSRCWEEQIKALQKTHTVIAYDLRGFGKSALPEFNKAYSHTDDLKALLDYLKIEKVILVGHSFGGRVATDFIFQYPERVIALVLPEGAMDLNDVKPPDKELIEWIVSTWTAGSKEGIEKAKEIWMNGSPLTEALINPKSSGIVKTMINDYSGWHWKNSDPLTNSPAFSIKKLNTIKVPVLIIWGEKSPPYYYELAKIQHENMGKSKLVMLKNASHALNNENPKQFNKELIKFLKKNKL
jgi:pimeloyl-ACP methyl ester carboxylesterase